MAFDASKTNRGSHSQKIIFLKFSKLTLSRQTFPTLPEELKNLSQIKFSAWPKFSKKNWLKNFVLSTLATTMVHSKSCFFRKPAEKSKKIGAQKIRGRLSLVFLILKRLRLHLSHFFQTSL